MKRWRNPWIIRTVHNYPPCSAGRRMRQHNIRKCKWETTLPRRNLHQRSFLSSTIVCFTISWRYGQLVLRRVNPMSTELLLACVNAFAASAGDVRLLARLPKSRGGRPPDTSMLPTKYETDNIHLAVSRRSPLEFTYISDSRLESNNLLEQASRILEVLKLRSTSRTLSIFTRNCVRPNPTRSTASHPLRQHRSPLWE